ncbi:pyrimidine/purine nucleoside phosphorylase [Colwellia piezophila]|uniref:pyrimidine/purine nucleoside phosphorylase n=1 Tax=Colwellia piezophila TaxID=211668 RepID=UPI000365F029|nr:pyrimidine/purine nucleoside phosphorylase [Colwellia piezophila]
MSEFKQVTVSKAANVYFDGKVTSRKITFSDGSFKTLGIMMPGDYKFATNEQELMEITAGECEILLAGASDWQSISAGQSFEVAANSAFEIKAKTLVDYCCTYIS